MSSIFGRQVQIFSRLPFKRSEPSKREAGFGRVTVILQDGIRVCYTGYTTIPITEVYQTTWISSAFKGLACSEPRP